MVNEALNNWRQLIQEASKNPTHVEELVLGDPDYKRILHTSGEGAGGIWVSGTQYMAPIVWQVPWLAEARGQSVDGNY